MALSDNMRGAAFMTGSMVAFTANDVFMKALADDVPLFQALFVRMIAVVILLFFIAWRSGVLGTAVSRRDKKLIAIRTVAETGAAYFFLTALFNMPIANVTAILQALPLTVSLAGSVFLGEKIGWRRLSAIIIGFIGVLLIVRPSGADFSVYSLYALAAVACVTVRDLSARKLSRDVPSVLVAFITAICILIFFGLGSAFVSWTPLSATSGGFLVFAAVFVIGGYIFSVAAMRVGEIGVVTPFRYSSLIAALILGFLVFGEWPDALTLLGSVIVVATGLFTLYRERHTGGQAAATSSSAIRPR